MQITTKRLLIRPIQREDWPASHGKGYAREAHAALFAALRALGVKRFTAGTALANTPSVHLLTALGFRPVGTEKVSFYQDASERDIVFDGGIFELSLDKEGNHGHHEAAEMAF